MHWVIVIIVGGGGVVVGVGGGGGVVFSIRDSIFFLVFDCTNFYRGFRETYGREREGEERGGEGNSSVSGIVIMENIKRKKNRERRDRRQGRKIGEK